MWDLILNPMVTLMAALYALMGNSVILSIVVLTLIIRMLMYPLLSRGQRNARKMAEAQAKLKPEMKKLEEKYKDDREALSRAQMELMSKHGINPLGGCLPMLVQFPIFIALYQTISFALASTPYQLVDLSERLLISGLAELIPLQNTWLGMNLAEPPAPPANPLYALVFPVLVMITTYIQFKVSQAQTQPATQTSDDDQDSSVSQAQAMTKSMGTIMPIMFGFISYTLSVGLSIYFITGNLIGIVQYSPIGKRVLDRIFMQPEDEEEDERKKKKREDESKKLSAKGKKSSGKKSSKKA